MKYRLTDETIKVGEVILHRIECVTPFADVKVGDKGGWIEKESNLSQTDNAWVYGDARVFGYAEVKGNASVFGYAEVKGNAQVYGYAEVYGHAEVYDYVEVYGHAEVYDYVEVYGNASVFGCAEVYGNAGVFDSASVFDNAKVHGNAKVYDDAKVYGDARVYDYAVVNDSAQIYDCAVVNGYAKVYGDAKISRVSDYIVFKNNFSSGRYFTWTRSNNMWAVGCFYGTGEELIKKARLDSKVKARYYALYVKLMEDFQKVKL